MPSNGIFTCRLMEHFISSNGTFTAIGDEKDATNVVDLVEAVTMNVARSENRSGD